MGEEARTAGKMVGVIMNLRPTHGVDKARSLVAPRVAPNSRVTTWRRLAAAIVLIAWNLALGASAMASTDIIIDLDARVVGNYVSQTAVVVSLGPGTYTVRPIGIAEGGKWDAWGAWPENVCDFCKFQSSYELTLPSLPSVNYWDGHINYETPIEALAHAVTATFTLTSTANVRFSLNDCCLGDNRGGMSLSITTAQQPTITSITPQTGRRGSTIQSFTVNGTNFQANATISFSGSGITINSYSDRATNHIVASISIASDAAIDARDVTLTVGSQHATAPSAFSILSAPVVVIPGIMGSELYATHQTPPDIWIDAAKLFLSTSDSFLDVLKLDTDGGTAAGINLGQVFTKSTCNDCDFYDALLDDLISTGYEVVTFPYDWRLDNETNADKLKSFLDDKFSTSTKVDIVSHSMGGLIARRFATKYGSQQVGKVIYIGTPHLGAPLAFVQLSANHPLTENFIKLPFMNVDTLANISVTWPSLFQLLPRYSAVFSDGSPVSNWSSLLRSIRWLDCQSPFDFRCAVQFHQNINVDLDVPEYVIAGSGVPTLGGVDLVGADWRPITENGDQTVPLKSSVPDGFPIPTQTFYVKGVVHNQLPKHPAVRALVLRILADDQGPLPPDSGTTPFAFEGVVEWNSESPINLRVVDKDLRLNGRASDGSLRTEIPRSSFFLFPQNEAGLLPPGAYGVDIRATATGAFSLNLTERDASGLSIRSARFADVPISMRSTGTLSWDSNGALPVLSLDVDGDGAVDVLIQPNQPVAPSTSLDILRLVIKGLTVNKGIETSLLAKINSADNALIRGNVQTARNTLTALLKELAVQGGGNIASDDANGVAEAVVRIINAL